MATQTLDQKIQATIDKIAVLTSRISYLDAELPKLQQSYLDWVAINNYTMAHQRAAEAENIVAERAAKAGELKTLNTPDTGVLALLQAQKQVAIKAQQSIIDSALTPAQQIQLAQANAAATPAKSNTTTIIIIVVVVIVIVGFVAYFKMKK